MNREELLQMTSKEIEKSLNDNLSIDFKSEDETEVKRKMIDSVKPLFDNTVDVSVPYYTNRELVIGIKGVFISFKVTTKKTGKTVNVSRLRKKDIKTVGKFKFDNITKTFYNPYFEADDLNKFTVKLSKSSCSGGASISLKHRTEKLIDMLARDILFEEIQKQDKDWVDIRKTLVLYASQPKIKEECFKPNFNQEDWDNILQKTEEVNKELIDTVIENILNVLN